MHGERQREGGEKRAPGIQQQAQQDEVQSVQIHLHIHQRPQQRGVGEHEEQGDEGGELRSELVALQGTIQQDVKEQKGQNVQQPQDDEKYIETKGGQKLQEGSPEWQIEIRAGQRLVGIHADGSIVVIGVIAVAEAFTQEIEVDPEDQKEAAHAEQVGAIHTPGLEDEQKQ